jgi:[glutamine synthetase] adenylyltransferase / [glutamine synthetase]-adenylyl-L-tyrosine phosphorylase
VNRSALKKLFRASGRDERAAADWDLFEKAYHQELGDFLPEHNESLVPLASIFGRSLYLSQRLIRDPLLGKWFLEEGSTDKVKGLSDYQGELATSVCSVQTRADMSAALRHYRYRETLRQTVREILRLDDYASLGHERSDLAIACLDAAYHFLYDGLCQEWGRPLERAANKTSEFCVLGMGKLGGRDLNYSSDIDLIYFYSSDEGGFEKKSESRSHHQFFSKLGKELGHLLSENTAEGFVYRVDLDLRPEGRSGAIVNSMVAMEKYYETFGDNWERMALVKAYPVSGSFVLGNDFLERIHSFVFPGITDYSTIDQIRDLKERIEKSLNTRLSGGADPQTPGYHVKLGRGGIREIEFIVGAFQRLFGGRDPSLCERNTLLALARLMERGHLSKADGTTLERAYIFLRTIENTLQMLEDRQTHNLPQSQEDLEALACLVVEGDYTDHHSLLDMMMNDLLLYTTQVRKIFEELLEKR